MIRKIVTFFGVVALLALVAASILALLLVKERVHVTIESDEPKRLRADDPVAELRIEVADLKHDLESLAASLETNFAALEEEAAASEQAAAAGLARDERLAAQTRSEIDRVLECIARIEVQIRDSKPAAAESEAAGKVASELADSSPPAESTPPAAEPPPAAGAPPKKRFLRFELPSSGSLFDRRQTLTIVPSLSRVGFDAKSTLHDFTGVTSRVDGSLEVDLAHPERSPKGRVEVEAASLDTGVEGRDTDMYRTLAVEEHPKLRFDWTAFETKEVDVAARRIVGTATGNLTIRGRTRTISMPTTVTVDASRRVVVEGEARLRMSEFEVIVPTKLGVISVEDEVRIWIALKARAATTETNATDARGGPEGQGER